MYDIYFEQNDYLNFYTVLIVSSKFFYNFRHILVDMDLIDFG